MLLAVLIGGTILALTISGYLPGVWNGRFRDTYGWAIIGFSLIVGLIGIAGMFFHIE